MPLASFDFLPPNLLLTVVAVAFGFEPEWGNKGPNNDSPYRGINRCVSINLGITQIKIADEKKIDLMETRQFRKTSYISQKKKFISYILGNLRGAYFTKLQWKRFYCISVAQYVWKE